MFDGIRFHRLTRPTRKPWFATSRVRVGTVVVSLAVACGAQAIVESPNASAGPNTLYVAIGGNNTGTCQSASAPCATIPYAISQASPGDTIDVGPGTFSGDMTIPSCLDTPCVSPLTIQGSESGSAPATILNPANIQASNRSGQTTLNQLTIDGDISAVYGTAVDISDSTVTGGGVCSCETTAIVNITDSTLSGNSDAVDATDGSASISISASTISDNTVGIEGIDFGVSLAGTVLGGNGKDCESGGSTVADDGYNLDEDGTCGFSTANHSQSDVDPDLGPLDNNGGPTETQAPALGSPALDQIPAGTSSLCPGSDQRGVPRPQGSECDIGAVELIMPRDIISPNSVTATARSSFSFNVTTTGYPVPSMTEKGKLPKGMAFVDNGNGTATISGTPKKKGVHHLTITATFGSGTSKYVVSQAFTLTVTQA